VKRSERFSAQRWSERTLHESEARAGAALLLLPLKNSKLLFHQFLDVLEEFMTPGSYKFCYADTDSFMLALTRDQIDECVRPELRQRWNSTILPKWFVKSEGSRDEITASEKEPGLLKVEARITSGWFIAPSPKCYVMAEKEPCELEARLCDPQNEHRLMELLDNNDALRGAYDIKKKSSKGCKRTVNLW